MSAIAWWTQHPAPDAMSALTTPSHKVTGAMRRREAGKPVWPRIQHLLVRKGATVAEICAAVPGIDKKSVRDCLARRMRDGVVLRTGSQRPFRFVRIGRSAS